MERVEGREKERNNVCEKEGVEEGCALRVVERARGCIAKARRKGRVRRRVGVRETRELETQNGREWRRPSRVRRKGSSRIACGHDCIYAETTFLPS